MATTRQVKFLNTLHSALGTPFLWGGTNLNSGVDCSGLVWAAARAAGISGVPRTSEQQYHVGKPVQMGHLLPGDLIFAYPEPGGPGHVVVYIGHGKVIAAPHTGTNVQIQNLSDFQGKIVGARRILANPQGGVFHANQFVGGGNTMQQDAQTGAGTGQQQFHPPVINLPQLGNPALTAQQTLQNTLKPLNPNSPVPLSQGAQQVQHLQQIGQQAQPDYSNQLGALHDHLLQLGS